MASEEAPAAEDQDASQASLRPKTTSHGTRSANSPAVNSRAQVSLPAATATARPIPRAQTVQDHCASQGVKAGNEVVTSDGIHIAGWYIPAGDGAPPTATTVVMVHGYGGNKSGILNYAPGLHQHFILVAFDEQCVKRRDPTAIIVARALEELRQCGED